MEFEADTAMWLPEMVTLAQSQEMAVWNQICLSLKRALISTISNSIDNMNNNYEHNLFALLGPTTGSEDYWCYN
jgi:hypothetical protein